MAKYSKKTQDLIQKELKEEKKGRWKNRKQAIAVGLSKARRQGYKAPSNKSN